MVLLDPDAPGFGPAYFYFPLMKVPPKVTGNDGITGKADTAQEMVRFIEHGDAVPVQGPEADGPVVAGGGEEVAVDLDAGDAPGVPGHSA